MSAYAWYRACQPSLRPAWMGELKERSLRQLSTACSKQQAETLSFSSPIQAGLSLCPVRAHTQELERATAADDYATVTRLARELRLLDGQEPRQRAEQEEEEEDLEGLALPELARRAGEC
jgi:hypothetical protein